MRIVDNSGGLWTNIIKHRMEPGMAIRQNYIPDERVTKLLAEEVISSIKGSTKHKFSVKHIAGKLVIARFGSGTYSNGILKRKSPDGTDYIPLSQTTLDIRKIDGNNRGAAFILRETGQHIMNGLKILKLTLGPRGGKLAEIGWDGENEEIAMKQNKGFSTVTVRENKQGEKRFTTTEVPARPFIGISEELQNNLQTFWNKITR